MMKVNTSTFLFSILSLLLCAAPASAATTLTFTSGTGFSASTAEDGQGGSTDIPGITIQVQAISDANGTVIPGNFVWDDNTFFATSDATYSGVTHDDGLNTATKGMAIKSSDGTEFGLSSFKYYNWGEISSISVTVKGYRDSIEVASLTFEGFDSGYNPQTVNLTSNFGNVDEVRLYSTANSYHSLNSLVIDAVPPAVSDSAISISGASGIGGSYKIGDTVTATWDNTLNGDNNASISSVTVDFSAFGGGTAVVASNSTETWTATYTITAGSIDAINRNVSVTATNSSGGSTTTTDTTNATVDNIAPTLSDANISISGATGTGGAFKIGDTVTATWDNSVFGDDNSDTISSVIVNFSDFGGSTAVTATNASETWTATYTITAGAIDATNRNVSVSATDNAGNSTTTADTTNATVDNIAAVVSDASISISGATGTDGAFKIGDTVTATWDNTALGDDNSDTISSVIVNFSAFGSGAAVAATNTSQTWTATYTITAGAIDATNRNVSVTATDNAGNSTTTADTTNATVDNIAPVVSNASIGISGATGTGGAFKIGDTVTVTWDNSVFGDDNSDTISSVIVNFSDFGGGAAVAATNTSQTWTATYPITAGAIDATNRNVSVTATDNAGNSTTTADTTNATVDNIAPAVANITISGTPSAADTSMAFNVSFNDTVSNISTDDFSLTSTGSAAGTIASVSAASGASVSVTINSISGEGTLRLDFLSGTNLVDNAGNGAAPAFTSGAVHTVDVPTVPGAPSMAAATAGDAQATISFTAPSDDGGSAITSYTVTSNPGGLTETGATSPIFVSGLTNGTSYTFTVTATNSVGTGAASVASNSVTPKAPQNITFVNPGAQDFGTTPTLTATVDSGLTPSFTSATSTVCSVTTAGLLDFHMPGTCTINADQAGNDAFLPAAQISRSFTVNAVVPGAPTIGNAVAGDAQATVSFTAPSFTGGSAITGYLVTANPGGLTASGSSSPITITGLTNDTAYNFTVRASNSAGTGSMSAASNTVTPRAPDFDSDGDGVSDEQEIIDGTDPHDPDSYIEHAEGEYCLDWNGFLNNLSQIAEYRNASGSTLSLTVELRDIDGVVQSSTSFSLAASEQRDLIVNSLNGFTANTYGTVCAQITSGPEDGLDSQLVSYSLSGASFEFAYAAQYATGRSGVQYIGYNHFYPSLAASQLENSRFSFIQIANEETTAATGQLVLYDAEGVEVRRISLEVPAQGRRDVETHSLGTNRTGMIAWFPTDATSKFRVTASRYYFDSNSQLLAVAAVPARRGSSAALTTAFDTQSKLAVLELSNTTAIPVGVALRIFDNSGVPIPTAAPATISIPSMGTRHILLGQYLPDGGGSVTIDATGTSTVIAELFEYRLDSTQRLESVANAAPQVALGSSLRTSYNNFLGGCSLRLANQASSSETVLLSMTRYDGSPISITTPVVVPGNGIFLMDICSADAHSAYGEVLVVPTTPRRIVGDMVRYNHDQSAAIIFPLKQR